MNRTKTRKWVEAKVQNYDGDDWGNEYDDDPEPEEPPMPPPPRATGFRQPGQGLGSSSQPSSPALGPTQPTGPTGPTGPLGLRGVSGPPALHIQTQQPPSAAGRSGPAETASPFVSGPSSLGSATIEQIVSPQSANPAQGVAPGAYGASQDLPQRVVSPSSDRRMSPAPQSAGAVPTRFPPRKSSMSQQDPAEIPDVARFSQASERPSSSHSKPWVQDRPASPGGVRSPGTPSKPLPFIRPADIYRRMEEEKEKERRSMDSSRPSMDSVTSRGIERVASPAKPPPPPEPVQEQQEVSAPKEVPDVAEDSTEPPRQVARRKSDYNYRGILAGAPGPVPRSTATVSNPSNHPPHHAHIPTQSQRDSVASQGSSDDERRFSTSPKLPDLARMSAFGADLFSGSSGFASDAPPLPSIPDNSPLESTAKSPIQPLGQEEALSAPSDSSQPSQPSPATDGIEGDNAPSSKVEDQVNQVADPTFLRPSLPGGWISETVTTPGDGVTPGIATDFGARDSGGVSPVTESSAEIDQSHEAAAPDATGTSESVLGESGPRDIGLGLSQLPPLDTTSDASLASDVPQPEEAASAPPPPPKDSPRTQPTSPTPDTTASDIAPTAPLQPHKGDASAQDFRPEAIQRISTMSTVTNSSPVKESDVLREEIIKTLSPVRSSELFLQVTPPITGEQFTGDDFSGPVDRGAVRESAYLDDVYGDYWAGNDKKPDTLTEEDETTQPARQASVQDATPIAAQPEPSESQVPQEREVITDRPEVNRNRFSWELDSEEINTGADQGPPPVSEPAEIAQPASDQSTPLSPAARQQDIPQLTVETSAGGMSHQVSQASTLPPRRESEIPEPPSPVSVLTDRNAPPPEEGRRLSLAEEKVLIQASSHPVSPSPPSEQHPALAETSRSSPRTGSPVSPSAPKPDLMSFRQILDLPNPGDRIAKYQETRAQFAGIDSGLEEWLVHMRTYIPEHAGASGSFNYPLGMGPPPGADGQNYPALAVPPGVQPYYQQYQQYLSASTTNLHSPTSGRPVGGLTGSSQFGSSDLRHSTGQVGAKGKELLRTAGKAGKGLWGKSKNKLKGTGDKVFH